MPTILPPITFLKLDSIWFFSLAGFTFVFPVCLGLIKWGFLDKTLRFAWLNPMLAFSITIVSVITARFSIHNHFLYYAIAILATTFYLLFYLQIVRNVVVRRIMIISTLFIFLMVFSDVLKWGLMDFYNAPFVVSNVLLIILSLWVMQNVDLSRPLQIINWTLFIYLLADLTYTLLSPLLYNYLQNDFLTMLSLGIMPFFNFGRALMFTYAFWIIKPLHPPDFSDIQGLKSAST